MGRVVGFEPTTSRTTIWRYYQLSYTRRTTVKFSKSRMSRISPPPGRGGFQGSLAGKRPERKIHVMFE